MDEPLTWSCHVCKRERPDALISVRTFTFDNGDGIPVTANVRYCNDTPACYDGAEHVSFVDTLRDMWGPKDA